MMVGRIRIRMKRRENARATNSNTSVLDSQVERAAEAEGTLRG